MKKMLAVVSASMIVQPVAAQSSPSPLGVAVWVTEESAACGVTETSMLAAIRAAMRYNRIEEETEPTPVLVEVTVNAGEANGSCLGSINVKVEQATLAVPPGMTSQVLSSIVFCEVGSLMGGPNMGTRMSDAVRQYFDECLSQIQTNTIR